MNLLSLELLKGLLNEDELPNTKKVIGMFGGGFKPPTSGHLEVVKRALQENPEMDLMLILVGSGTRNSISQEESIAVWNMYAKYLPSKVRVMASPDNKAPIAAIYSYGKKNPDKEIYWFIGAREGNEGDFQDIANRTKSLRKGDYPNIKVKEIVTTGAVSGTKARQALLTKDKETFTSFLPNIPEIDQIWDMLADVIDVNEDKTSILGKYDREELKKGIEVEKEHTDDPKIALKIALDHLDEDPEYYTKLATLGLEETQTPINEDRYKGYKRFLKANVFIDFPDYIINDMFRETNDLDYSKIKGMKKDEIINHFFKGEGQHFFKRWGGFQGQKKPKVIEIKWEDLTKQLQDFLKNKMSGKNPNFAKVYFPYKMKAYVCNWGIKTNN